MSNPDQSPLQEFLLHYKTPFRKLGDFFWQQQALVAFLNGRTTDLPLESPRWKRHWSFALYTSTFIALIAWPLTHGIELLLPSPPVQTGTPVERVSYTDSLNAVVAATEILIFPATVLLGGLAFGIMNRSTQFAQRFDAAQAYYYFASARLFWPSLFITISMFIPPPPDMSTLAHQLQESFRTTSSMACYTWLIIAITRYVSQLSLLAENEKRPTQCRPAYLGITHFGAQLIAIIATIVVMMLGTALWHQLRVAFAEQLPQTPPIEAPISEPEEK